jgi:hypothetical protein
VFLRRYAVAVAGADADRRSMDQAAGRLCQTSTAQLSGSATSDGAAYSLVEGISAHDRRSDNSKAFCTSMRRGRALGLIAAGVVGLVAGCNGSPSSRIPTIAESSTASAAPSTSNTPGATGSGKTACDLITPDVIHAADFTYRVVRQATSNGAGKNGTSSCTYGDDPDTSHISLNFLALLILTPASLKAQHTTGERGESSGIPLPPECRP